MMRLRLLAAKPPDFARKGSGMLIMSEADPDSIPETVRKCSIARNYQRIYNSQAA